MDSRAALTTLTRLAFRKPEQARGLDQSFQDRLEGLAEASLDVAIETGEPVGSRLARQIEPAASTELAERSVERFDLPRYDDSIPLIEPALTATLRLLDHLRAEWPEPVGRFGPFEESVAAAGRESEWTPRQA